MTTTVCRRKRRIDLVMNKHDSTQLLHFCGHLLNSSDHWPAPDSICYFDFLLNPLCKRAIKGFILPLFYTSTIPLAIKYSQRVQVSAGKHKEFICTIVPYPNHQRFFFVFSIRDVPGYTQMKRWYTLSWALLPSEESYTIRWGVLLLLFFFFFPVNLLVLEFTYASIVSFNIYQSGPFQRQQLKFMYYGLSSVTITWVQNLGYPLHFPYGLCNRKPNSTS